MLLVMVKTVGVDTNLCSRGDNVAIYNKGFGLDPIISFEFPLHPNAIIFSSLLKALPRAL
jgi:hypothetical protein